jgi:UDP-N-acetylmuramate--alanine ligase
MVPIYPARELPIEGVCSEMIGRNLKVEWQLVEREALAERLRDMETDVVVTFGAGNIDAVCEDIYKALKSKL